MKSLSSCRYAYRLHQLSSHSTTPTLRSTCSSRNNHCYHSPSTQLPSLSSLPTSSFSTTSISREPSTDTSYSNANAPTVREQALNKSSKPTTPQSTSTTSIPRSTTTSQKPTTGLPFLDRLFYKLLGPPTTQPSQTKNWFLNLLGYYSSESQLIALSNSLYTYLLHRTSHPTLLHHLNLLSPQSPTYSQLPFAARFELLSLQLYLLLHRLRHTKNTSVEAQAKQLMQEVFETFWVDVRHRMLIEEEGFKYMQSGKWLKECESRFWGLALKLDQVWEGGNSRQVMEGLKSVVKRNITCLEEDGKKVDVLVRWLLREKGKFDAMRAEDLTNIKNWPE